MNFEGFIFDLDGTLIDSMYFDKAEIDFFADFLHSKGIAEFPDDFYDKLNIYTHQEAADYIVNDLGASCSEQDLFKMFVHSQMDKYANSIPLKKGVYEFLMAHRHKKMCILTANSRMLVEAVLKQHGIDGCFEFIMTCDETEHNKHAPEIFELCAQKLGLNTSQCVVFDDALYAVRSAKKSGCYVIGIAEKWAENDIGIMRQLSDEFVTDILDCTV